VSTSADRSPLDELEIRKAGLGDADGARMLVLAAYQLYVSRMSTRPAPMTADYVSVLGRGDTWIAERHGRILGLLVLEVADGHLLIENVAVAPEAQGIGIGVRLLSFAEDQARSRGLPEVRLYTNEAMTENLAFYGRRGYRETHRASDDGYQRVFFSRLV